MPTTVTPISVTTAHPRNGAPYTEADHEMLVAMLKERATLEHMSEKLGRQPRALLTRLRKLLPPEQRKCPTDRVVPAAWDVVTDEAYDWRRTILLPDPLPPVTHVTRSGVAGLCDGDLATVAQALAVAHPSSELMAEVREEVRQRGLGYEVVHRQVAHLRRNCLGSPSSHEEQAWAWAEELGLGGRYRWEERRWEDYY